MEKRTNYPQKIVLMVIVLIMIMLGVHIVGMLKDRMRISKVDDGNDIKQISTYPVFNMQGGMKKNPSCVRGIYVSANIAGDQNKINKLIEIVDKTPVNAMVIDIKNDLGEVTYQMDNSEVLKTGAIKCYITDIKALIEKLKQKNIYLIARIVTFRDPILVKKYPDMGVLYKDGSVFYDKDGLAWSNPYKKSVWDYNLNIALQAAKIGFDEIQFDYIRFSTDKGMKDVKFDSKYSRKDIITKFTEYISKHLKKEGVYVSADVYGTIINCKKDSEIVGQDYKKMAKYLDYISPMIYPSQYSDGSYGIEKPDNRPYEIVSKVMKDSNQILVNGEGKTVYNQARPWLQGFRAVWVENNIPYTTERIYDQIRAVYESGNLQWIIWNSKNNYEDIIGIPE